ncbi:hypothetical protein LTS02_017003 [Friedmanniomyces endolithicus]|nr:hypothetical protein LTS02_017003 [Friedmanniomyces endolithicus]
MLVLVVVFSHFGYGDFLGDKKAGTVVNSVNGIIDGNTTPMILFHDPGTEMALVKSYMEAREELMDRNNQGPYMTLRRIELIQAITTLLLVTEREHTKEDDKFDDRAITRGLEHLTKRQAVRTAVRQATRQNGEARAKRFERKVHVVMVKNTGVRKKSVTPSRT